MNLCRPFGGRQAFFAGLLFLQPLLAFAEDTLPSPTTFSSFVKMLLALAVVLAFLLGSLWLMKRLQLGQSANGLVRVVGAAAVGPRERVVVVQIEDRWLVVGVAPGRVERLGEMDRPEGGAPETVGAAPGFGERLAAAVRQRGQP